MKSSKFPLLLILIWILVVIVSLVAPRFVAATGDGFTRGLNRVGIFLGWQFGAFTVAVVLAIIVWTRLNAGRSIKWLFSIPLLLHLLSVLLVVGFLVYTNMSKPISNAYVPPATPTAVAEALPVEPPVSRETKTYRGIYRSGFEMSHFYSMDGEGPFWLESNDSDWETLQSHFVDGPGRSGGVTVALTMDAYVSDIGSDFGHLGPIEQKIHVVSIDAIRPISQEEFDQVLAAIQK